jgi:PAS domain S-box-containing protein
MGPVSTFSGAYDYRLVALSISISILASYAALDLAERVTTSKGGARVAWLYGGATAMGFGIWTMHYVGMVAFRLPIPVLYDWPTVAASLFAAIAASGAALFVVSRPTMGLGRTALGSLFMGSAIAGMHYIGMAAMRIQAMCIYSVSVVGVSIFLAIAISFAALELAFAGRHSQSVWDKGKLWSGLTLGLAIPVMHYVGMAAVKFVPEAGFNGDVAHSTSITSLGLGTVIGVTLIILLHVEIISKVSRRFSRQAEQLVESGRQLKVVFDSLVEGIAVLDVRRAMVRMNPAAQRIFGMPSDELPLQQARSLLRMSTPEGDLLSFDQWPSSRTQRGEFQQNSEILVHSNHIEQARVVQLTSAPIANESGECVQVIFTCRDVTERRRADDARARLAAIVESSQDGIIGKDLNGIVTSWNRGAEQIFGYLAEEMIGESIQVLLPPGLEAEENTILERLRRGEVVEHLQTVRQRKDGRHIDVSLMISPIRDGKGRIVGASKIVRDITENRLLERQLRQSQKMEAIGQLTGGIAHDFNNLLAIVIGNLGLLERMLADNEPAMKRLLPAQKASLRGADLTRRLLALASKQDLNPIDLRLEDAIHETIELAGRALGPEIKIVTNIDSSVPPVFVDGAGLASALLNLASMLGTRCPRAGL